MSEAECKEPKPDPQFRMCGCCPSPPGPDAAVIGYLRNPPADFGMGNTFLGKPVVGMDVSRVLERNLDVAGRKLDLLLSATGARFCGPAADVPCPPEATAGLFLAARLYTITRDALACHRPAAA